jgi:dipeptide/tripeptide permease
MEIFERMGWYGFYAVSSLYLTGSIADGGLGFSSEDRGVIQGLATFFLYLFPAVFGALADRYGFKKMFLSSTLVMIPGYLLLGIPTGFWGFLAVYFLVAIGHGMFKPVVISTVAKSTNEKTGSMGFGIFYMMVNIGGAFGPIVAGFVRGWDWQYVFYCSAGWILLMGLIALFVYQEPPRDDKAESSRSLSEVFSGMVGVVGNGRFFILVAGLLLLLVMGSKWLDPGQYGPLAGGWLALNFLWDAFTRGKKSSAKGNLAWYSQPMKIGEGRYLIFLVLMAFFWTSFNQIFMTLPEYIRDYVNTGDLINSLGPIVGLNAEAAQATGSEISSASRMFLENGQVKPELLINLNAAAIIFLQIPIAYFVRKLPPLTCIILGSFITVISFLLYLIGMSGWIIVVAIFIFSIGEMLASPRSKEYAGNIAPPNKVGMYMGYFYWCVALGNLFGGLLSGGLYQYFGPAERGGTDNTNAMWIIFAGLAMVSVVLLSVYDKWIKAHPQD